MNSTQQHGRDHAIVLGGSMAGLLAARILADRYRQVTLVERDSFPAGSQQRRGVPQGRHTHGLLASGARLIENLFPGIRQSLIEDGAVTGDIVRDGRWFFEGGCHSRFASGLEGLLVSRPLLESKVRERVLAFRNVQVRDRSDAKGLIASDDRIRVTGVRTAEGILEADLVVDAMGRGSRGPQWLEALGYQKPEEERVEIALGYTTRLFRRTRQDLGGDMAVVIPPTPKGKRGGVMIAQEGDRWTVTLTAHFGNYAPEDLPGFIEFARTLPAPFIYEVVRNAEPLGDPASARYPASTRRRYEKLEKFPAGFLVFGDAICSFNPVYGQGMSVAALQSLELAAALARNPANPAREFFSRAARVIDIPWSIAVGNDLRMPEATGPRNLGVRLINWYMVRLHRAAHSDPVATLAFHQVANLLAPPPSVMHPRVAARVLWRNLLPSRPELAVAPSARAQAAAR